MSFAKRLQELRISKNLTQPELSKIISVSDRSISAWERGLQLPNSEITIKLASYFNVSLDYLLCHETFEFDNNDDSFVQIQRAYKKLSPSDKNKMIEINKIMFKEAFGEDK